MTAVALLSPLIALVLVVALHPIEQWALRARAELRHPAAAPLSEGAPQPAPHATTP